jgi:hypothetical protein
LNIRRPRGKLVKYHINQLERAITAIYKQAEDDETPAANDPPDDPTRHNENAAVQGTPFQRHGPTQHRIRQASLKKGKI